MMPADAIVDGLVDTITSDLDPAPQAALGVLVNGLGATTPMELAIVLRRALFTLRGRGYKVTRAWAGNLMTALEMPGCSISVLKLDPEREALLAAPTTAPAWPGDGRIPQQRAVLPSTQAVVARREETPGPQSPQLKRAFGAVADALEAAEAQLTDLDAQAGDGDLGASMTRGAAALRSLADAGFQTPGAHLMALGDAVRRAIAGSSGPFYATALLRAGAHLRGRESPDGQAWREAFEIAVSSVAELGGAKPGDRTMLDALFPALEAWKQAAAAGAQPPEAFRAAADAAAQGARRTQDMVPSLGRASYLGRRALGVPDGGAVAVGIWMKALADAVARSEAGTGSASR
jgi:dihydroxyacetone kinase